MENEQRIEDFMSKIIIGLESRVDCQYLRHEYRVNRQYTRQNFILAQGATENKEESKDQQETDVINDNYTYCHQVLFYFC